MRKGEWRENERKRKRFEKGMLFGSFEVSEERLGGGKSVP